MTEFDDDKAVVFEEQYRKSYHDYHFSVISKNNDHIIVFSANAIKSVSLTAAGGIAAALGFYSANYTNLIDQVHIFNAILKWLLISLFCSVVTSGFAYLCQYCYGLALIYMEQTYEIPYLKQTKKSRVYNLIGIFLHIISIILIILAYIALSYSGYLFLKLV